MPLSQNDCRTLSSALEIIYGIMSVDQFPYGVLSVIGQTFTCDAICYNAVSLPDMNTTWFMEPAEAMPSHDLKKIFAKHMAEHPLFVYYTKTGDGRSLRISDLLSQQQFHDSRLYSEFYKPTGVEYQLGSTVSTGPYQIIGLAIDRHCSDFSENERLCLDLLRPHLVQAYRNVQMLDLAKKAAEQTGNKMLVVDRSGQVSLDKNDTWRTISRYFDVTPSSKKLPDNLQHWIKHERARFWQASGAPTPSVSLVVTNEKGQLTLQFIWGGKVASQDLILLKEKPVGIYPALTRREAEIITWLSQGKTNVEIGEALSISPRTVKKHLEHIYTKLQVHRRSGAVAHSLKL